MISLLTVISFVSLAWLIVLTYFIARFYSYHAKILKDGKKESLVAILDTLCDNEKRIEKKMDELVKKCDKLEGDELLHIQKVGLLRFNPFNDTGGDQSFILALVDAHNTGVIISSLHTRTGTRWYAKKVLNGKGGDYELSEEEKKALMESTHLKK